MKKRRAKASWLASTRSAASAAKSPSSSVAMTRTSEFSSTTLSRAEWTSRTVYSRPGPSFGCCSVRTTRCGACFRSPSDSVSSRMRSRGRLLAATGITDSPADAVLAAEVEIKYDGYLAREREAAVRLAELASFVLPPDLPYLELRTLATEARQKLDRVRPTSLAQAARIPGVTPSDLHSLVLEATRWRRRVA